MDETQIAMSIIAQQRNTALDGLVTVQVELERLRAENASLKAENERLKPGKVAAGK